MDNRPKWHRELDQFKSFKTTFIFEGNIYDLHFYCTEEDNRWIPMQLDEYLKRYLVANHYSTIVYYNHVDGFYAEESHLRTFLELANTEYKPSDTPDENSPSQTSIKCQKASLDKASIMIRTALGNRQTSTVVIMNCASRYITSPEGLNEEERQFYSRLFLTTISATQVKTEAGLVNNLLFIVADKTNDIPTWFYLGNNFVKLIHIGTPDKRIRRRFIDTQNFIGMEQLEQQDLEIQKDKFVDLTDGFTNRELNSLRSLCKQENIPINKISNAISIYKYVIIMQHIFYYRLTLSQTFLKGSLPP